MARGLAVHCPNQWAIQYGPVEMRCTHFSAKSGDSATNASRLLGLAADFLRIAGSSMFPCWQTSKARVSASNSSVRLLRMKHKQLVCKSDMNLSLHALSSITEQTTASLRSMASAGSTSLVSEKRYIRCNASTAQYRFCNCELRTAMSQPSISGCTGNFEKATRGKGSTEISTCFTPSYQSRSASSGTSSAVSTDRVLWMYPSTVMTAAPDLFLPTFLGATWSSVLSMIKLTAACKTLSSLL
mmetsp:Transcript_3843/g.8965  ORF Transcript_3843/g.8965 Transcript_3843/m.8965 type:complete len:242 (+) Transcript_3843:208-933(+)